MLRAAHKITMYALLILSINVLSIHASELDIPNEFADGQVTSAADMNANFAAIQAAVNDNNSRINTQAESSRTMFLGFSSATVNGGSGVITMQQMCHNDWPGSHICNTSEVAGSSYNANAPATMAGKTAWILVEVNTATNETWSDRHALVGVHNTNSLQESLSCKGWQEDTSSSHGAYIHEQGFFDRGSCSAQRAVACCEQKIITLTASHPKKAIKSVASFFKYTVLI